MGKAVWLSDLGLQRWHQIQRGWLPRRPFLPCLPDPHLPFGHCSSLVSLSGEERKGKQSQLLLVRLAPRQQLW